MIDGAAQRDERRRPSFVPDVKDPRCVIFGAPSESSFSDHVIEFYNIFGWQAGMIVLTYSAHGDRVKRFAAWAAVTGLLGLALCGASLDDGPIPVNKNLWSLSYVLATTGTAFALMAVVYVVVDVKEWWSGAPFYQAGECSVHSLRGGQTRSLRSLPPLTVACTFW